MKSTEYEKKYNETLNNPRHAKVEPKKTKKSKHKHEPQDFLIAYHQVDFADSNKQQKRISRIQACVHCGKIYNIFYHEHEKIGERHLYRILTNDEVLEKYKDLLLFDTETVVRHVYELNEKAHIDIREIYKTMIRQILPEKYEIREDDITRGLSKNITPDKMSLIIMRRTECVPHLKGDKQ